MEVMFADLRRIFDKHANEYESAALRVLHSGWYILGVELESFEKEFASYIGKKYCIGVGCGQDALTLGLRCLDIGPDDEVIVAGNTFIATVLGVTENGATPKFVDCNSYFQIDETKIEAAITSRTKAVLVTNLYGQCSNLVEIRRICDKYGLYMLEDCAQSHGAQLDGFVAGTVGDITCFSFYPTKPLGAFGDAGAVLTDDETIAEKLKMLRNYGSKQKYVNEITGTNSRLDEIQAAFLRVNLKYIDQMTEERIRIANRYLSEIKNPCIKLPKVRKNEIHVFHIFSVLCKKRNELKTYLSEKGIQTQIHYPIPPHKAPCYRRELFCEVELPMTELYASEELSLPIYCGMPEEDVDWVIDAVNSFEAKEL